jgi:hypothetical protein
MNKDELIKAMAEQMSQAGSTKSGRVHIMSSKNGWAIKNEGSKRALVVKSSKKIAIQTAIQCRTNVTVVIHKKDGTIEKTIINETKP